MSPNDKIHYTKLQEQDSEEKIGERNFEVEESDNTCNQANKKWTSRMKLVAFATLMVYFVVFTAVSIITPYFPTVAVEEAISKSVAGLIFSVYALVGIVTSLVIPTVLPVIGPRTLLSACLVLAGVAQIAFGLGTRLPTNTSFIVYSLICRGLISLGGSSCYTTAVSLAAQEVPRDFAFLIGLGESFAGIATIFAPAVGGAIYQSAGYFWPTFALGIMMLAAAFLIFVMLRDFELETHKTETSLFRNVLKFMKLPGILIGVEIIFLASLFRTVLDPVYAIFGKEVIHLDTRGIGLLYTSLWLFYFISSASVGNLADRSEKHFVILCLGFISIAVGFLLLGPTPLLIILPVGTIWLAVMANILVALGFASVFVPSMPYLVKLASADHKLPNRDGGLEMDITTSGLLSGVATSVIQLGEFAGPTAVTVIADFVDVRWDFSILGFLAFGQSLLLVMYTFCRYVCSSDTKAEGKQMLPTHYYGEVPD